MSPSTHTRSGRTTSTEITTPAPSNSSYVTQTDFSTAIKDLFSKFNDKFKEYLKESIAYQYAKSDGKIKKEIQNLVTPYLRGFYQVFIKTE